ncbi:TetR/AcrR family transcriptional regulator [Clostridioides difficile]|nr:TetR/AcrR family transcriptional regulator [Clostridioides difficile]
MPKIFSDARKQSLYKIIKQNCINLIREKGYKQLNIRELAKTTGISTGTFYNFYNSKEDLILSIMEESQHNLENRFFKILECNGKITKSEFVERFPELSLFYRLFSPLNSEMICIFPYFCPYAESAREIRGIFVALHINNWFSEPILI